MLEKIIQSEIYSENIGEIGFLLLNHQDYMIDNDISWLHGVELQDRLRAHLDCLILGEDLAVEVIQHMLETGDDDEFLGACYAQAAIKTQSNIKHEILIKLFCDDISDSHPLIALASKNSTSTNLSNNLLSLVDDKDPLIRAVVIDVIGYRGDADPRRIWPRFHDEDESVKVAAMLAVMRLGFKEAVPAMEQAVLENKDLFNEHCVFPLLMLGSQKALQFSRLACQSADYVKPQYPIYLALGGNQDDIKYILKSLDFNDMSLAVLEALGIFGSLAGVKTLMQYLSSEDDEEKLAAAKSLNQLSGAQLFEMATVVEKDEDDIDAEEITGKPAAAGDDTQAGDERVIEVKQDCTDLERWTNWWQENNARFDPSIRYRFGKPYSFLLCLEEITHPESNYADRQRAYNEIVMRSGHHIQFEPDWFIDKQIEALKQWQTWWNENKTKLSNQWMFNGI